MTADRFVWLDRDHLVEATESPIHGVSIGGTSTAPSPYDIPEAMRGYVNSEGCGVVEMRYIGPDEPRYTVNIDDVHISTGKNSKRIYAFTFAPSLTRPSTADALQRFHHVILKFSGKPEYTRKDNYRLVDKALEERGLDVLIDATTHKPRGADEAQSGSGSAD